MIPSCLCSVSKSTAVLRGEFWKGLHRAVKYAKMSGEGVVRTMIRLIATDLDGTLLDSQSELSERTVRAVSQTMEAGAKFVLASGRMSESTGAFARQLSTNAPIIAFNGAVAVDWRTGDTLFRRAISAESARRVARMAEELGIFIQYFPERGFFYEKRVPEVCDDYEGRIRMRGVELLKPLSGWIEKPAMKLLSLGENAKLIMLRDEILAEFPEISAMLSHPTYLEIVSAGVDKGAALRSVAECFGIPREEVAAFGDADNDVQMLQYAGRGYAMESGDANVVAGAEFVAPSNDSDGVARVLEELLAQNEIGG